MSNKKIIMCGPTASGKNFIREKFKQRGYEIDVSYTSREPREGEKHGIDYHFIYKNEFEQMIIESQFYEWVKYGDNYYGTGLKEWKWCDIFIMETDGINKIKEEDRKNCLIIYLNTPFNIRYKRMKERGWDSGKILERIEVDTKKFKDFVNYDFQISSVCENEI